MNVLDADGAPPPVDGTAGCKRLRVSVPPTLVVTPTAFAFVNTLIGNHADQIFYLSNAGDDPLVLGNLALTVNPNNELAIVANNADGQTIPRGGLPRSVTVRFTPTQPAQRNATLQIPSNDPADMVGSRDVLISGTARFDAPVVEFLLPDGATLTNHVRVGLWDRAWNPANGLLYNAQADASNFVSRDTRSFCVRVTDPHAAWTNAATITVDWWTRRTDHQNMGVVEDDHHPGTASLTLTRVPHTNRYVSKPVMLVTDADDAAQGTDTGLGGGVAAAGAADHRLRRITVSAQYALDHLVRASYTHASPGNASPVEADVPVFDRGIDERRRILVHFVNVRTTAGGNTATTNGQLDAYEAALHSIYARAGIFLQIDRGAIDPPAACTGWAGRIHGGADPGVVVAVQERSQNPTQIVPHPTQSSLIHAAHVAAGEIYLFFVANIYDPLTGGNAGGEAFYHAQTTHPVNVPNALAALNDQLQAFNLSSELYRESQSGAHTALRQGIIGNLLADAQDAAANAHADNILLQAQAFWAHVEGERTTMTNALWLRTLIGQLQANAQGNLYAQPAYAAAMTAARGCAFVVTRALLGTDVAPAHEVTHITTNLNNVADGHYDLEDPNVAHPAPNTVGHDLPGHIDGKNLMHRYALDAGNPIGIDIPKRLWDQAATNNHRHPAMVIPAQITTILGNNVYIRNY